MNNAILLVTAVAIRNAGGDLQIDDQTYEGLRHWSAHFDKVTYVGLEEQRARGEDSSVTWKSLAPLTQAGKLNVLALPVGYRISSHIRHHRNIRRRLGELISQHQYLCFSLGALFGDWGAIASLEADAQGRKFAVWFDRVEHVVQRVTLPSMPLKRRLKTTVMLPFMKAYHEHLIRRAAVGIFQGRDCFDYFRSHSANPKLVYDTHTKEHHLISAPDLERKLERIRSGAPLRFAYAGRAAAMKGPEDWIETLVALHGRGVAFEAHWYGDGPSLPAMREQVVRAGLSDVIHLHGHVGDREYLLSELRASDIFLFCHKTPESPRCLIEALVSGAPLVGYHSAYADGLIENHCGGMLTPVGDVSALVREIVRLNAARPALEAMVRQAAISGRRFDEEAIYRGRAELMRTCLDPAAARA
jgi:glycosyltransferase involved in cell wall biosynthesis